MNVEIPFSGHLSESFSPQSSKETMINMFSEIDPGRTKVIRRQRPGLTLKEALAGSNLRGIEYLQGVYWCVVDDRFYEWDGVSTLTERGSLNTTTGNVTMATNNAATTQIAVCDGTDLFVWDTSTFTQVSEVGWTPKDISSIGGYGVMADGTVKGRFYTTSLNDFKTIDVLDFANAESKPDDIRRVFVDRGEVWMFGHETTEVYRLSGTSFPLNKVTGSEMERGCAAQFSVASDDNSIFWLGDDGVVYRANGYSPQRISTHAIERKIAELTDMSTGQAFFIQFDGHKFYTLRFADNFTVQYNVATGLWNECNTYLFDDWQVVGSAGRTSKYVLDSTGINLLDRDVNEDNGTVMRRVCISPPIYNLGERFQVFSFHLDCEVGRTTGTEPSVMLETSRDGESWGNILTRAMGATGEYNRRVMWRNLGVAREMQFRISMTDDAQFKVMGSGGNIVGANG